MSRNIIKKRVVILFILIFLVVSLGIIGYIRYSRGVGQKTVQFSYTENCNYVYHMMSVAKCGYNNEYGKKYQDLHSEEDLSYLKDKEDYITVSGGEHEGSLYADLVAIPASKPDTVDLKQYYLDLAKKAGKSNSSDAEAEKKIAEIMAANYDIYDSEVWSQSQQEIALAAEKMQDFFNQKDYMTLWEKETGYTFKKPFNVLLCNSLSYGPEAILITNKQDVFGIIDDYPEAKYNLICHEAGMALFRQNNIFGFETMQEALNSYPGEEGLTEYYNERILGFGVDGMWDPTWINWFKEKNAEGNKTPKELFSLWKEEQKQ